MSVFVYLSSNVRHFPGRSS